MRYLDPHARACLSAQPIDHHHPFISFVSAAASTSSYAAGLWNFIAFLYFGYFSIIKN